MLAGRRRRRPRCRLGCRRASSICTDPLDLRLALRDKGLTAEAGVDRHHQHQIHVASDLLSGRRRRGRVDGDAGAAPERLMALNRPVQVGQDLGVHGQVWRAAAANASMYRSGSRDHQVHIERQLRHAPHAP